MSGSVASDVDGIVPEDPWHGLADELDGNGFPATATAVRIAGMSCDGHAPDGLEEDVRLAYRAAVASGMADGLLLYTDVRLARIVSAATGDDWFAIRNMEQAKVVHFLYALETKRPYAKKGNDGPGAMPGGNDAADKKTAGKPEPITSENGGTPAKPIGVSPHWAPMNPAPADTFRL